MSSIGINKFTTPKVNTWLGLAYERLCMAHIPQIKAALGISGFRRNIIPGVVKSISLQTQYRPYCRVFRNMVNLCEIKYSNGQYVSDKAEYDKILEPLDGLYRRNERVSRASS